MQANDGGAEAEILITLANAKLANEKLENKKLAKQKLPLHEKVTMHE